MNATQTMKEARQLAWPWTIIMAAGLLILATERLLPPLRVGLYIGRTSFGPPMWHSLTDWILPLGAFFGTVLLANLPLGSEFQYRTLASRLAQPMGRSALWREKFLVTIAAVAPVGLIYCIALGMRFGRPFALMAAVWIVVATAGAIPCTLLARSTMGGMVMCNFGTSIITIGWTYYEKHNQLPAALLLAMSTVLGTYVIVMIWLGRRMLLHFQAVDGLQAGEGFVPGARLVPAFFVDWLRCRPGQRVANLVRREFRMLRVVWAMTLVYALAWIYLVVFHQLPNENPESLHVVFVLTVILGSILAVLAGNLSLGEEKTWGTHQWHMTIPMSVSAQWMVKLGVALFTSIFSVVLLPAAILSIGLRVGAVAPDFAPFLTPGWIAAAAALTFASFWCACAVKGTVQATLWVFPLGFIVWIAGPAAGALISPFEKSLQRLVAFVVMRFDPIKTTHAFQRTLDAISFNSSAALFIAVAPLIAVAVIQSHRAFRGQVSANRLWVVRYALPLVIASFLWSFAGMLFFFGAREAYDHESNVLRETNAAIAKIVANDAPRGTTKARRVTADELAQAAPLSDATASWLRDAQILVGPAPAAVDNHRAQYFVGHRWISLTSPGGATPIAQPYSAVIRTRSGTQCAFTYQAPDTRTVPWRFTYVSAVCE